MTEDFFNKFGLEVKRGEVEVGSTYPIYGMITDFLNETLGSIEVEINYQIDATLLIESEEKLETLKERAFEPGIFVSTITSKEEGEKMKAEVSTVVFGRKQNNSVN